MFLGLVRLYEVAEIALIYIPPTALSELCVENIFLTSYSFCGFHGWELRNLLLVE
jgi:branched-subunit amino acid transport protein